MSSFTSDSITNIVRVLLEKGTYFHCNNSNLPTSIASYDLQGEVPPYQTDNDILITLILLGLFFTLCPIIGKARPLLVYQLKQIFAPKQRNDIPRETGNSHLFLLLFLLSTGMTLSVFIYHLRWTQLLMFPFIPGYQFIGISFAAIMAYFILKTSVHFFTDWIFFERINVYRFSQIRLWNFAFEGLLLYPILVVGIYAQLPYTYALFSFICVVIFCKMILFYKGMQIFFTNYCGLLLNILYFCTLELIPLLIAVKVVVDIN